MDKLINRLKFKIKHIETDCKNDYAHCYFQYGTKLAIFITFHLTIHAPHSAHFE